MSRSSKGLNHAVAGWLVGPLCLAAVAAGWALVQRGPGGLFGAFVGVAVGLALVWVLVSSLWPARADRHCPECGAEALRRLDPGTTHGLQCAACGYRDETVSSFLLAEEEGPLEEMVLSERRGR